MTLLEPKAAGATSRFLFDSKRKETNHLKEVMERKGSVLKSDSSKGYALLEDGSHEGKILSGTYETLHIFVDGNVRNNHTDTLLRKAAVSVVIYGDGHLIHSITRYLGDTVRAPSMDLIRVSGQLAEYAAMLLATSFIQEQRPDYKNIIFMTDSRDMVEHISTIMPKSPIKKDFVRLLRHRFGQIEKAQLKHIPREMNRLADKFANECIMREERR